MLLERRVRRPRPTLSVLKSRIKEEVACSVPRARTTLLGFFPVVTWLPKYKLREYVWGDLMSGLIIGIILVPQAIAYCLLAGVEPIYGLYTSFFANIIYFFMGTSRHVSVGIFSLMSLMVGQVVEKEVFRAGFDLNDGPDPGSFNVTSNLSAATVDVMGVVYSKESYAIGIATALTLLVGIYQVLMAVFRLGFVSVYLSAPMLDGFATGASFTILTVQAKYLLGLKIPRHQGFGTVVVTWINIFANIQNTNVCDLVTSAICIFVLVAGKELQERYKSRLKIPLPTELVVVAGATLASHFGNLNTVYASSVSGHIPTGFAFTVSLSEMFAKKNGYTVRPNQEMLAIGCCNIIPSCFHCFTTSAALAKTMVKDSTGCQTQVSSLVSALVVLLVLLFFAPYFYALQKCVLACIIIVSLRGALRKICDIPAKWRASRADAVVWLVAMSATVLISVEIGLLVGVVFSMLCVIFIMQNPKVSLLGRSEDSNLYEDLEDYENLAAPVAIRVFRFQAPLYYANKESFLKALYGAVGVDPFMELTCRRKAEKKAAKLLPATSVSKDDLEKHKNGALREGLVRRELEFHTIVLDCSAIPFIDSAGMAAFIGLVKDYGELGVAVLLASCNTPVIDTLRRGAFFGEKDRDMGLRLFFTVHDAVLAATSRVAVAEAAAATEHTADDSQV
ncbi:hypothetical protein CRUP_018301 [Coryphaenoides rupestris]|nr:hypothetical protein CRUP_018301 [Coryphaenoides rupestris]